MSAIRFAITGCGKISLRHAAEAARQGQLVAVCDIVPEKADQLAAEFGVTAYYHLTDLLKSAHRPDVLAVCTPNGIHAEDSVLAMESGCHVLCEKPMCITVNEAERMIRVSRETGRKLFVVKSARYNPGLIGLKKLLEEDQLGKLYSFQLNCFWNRPPAYYAGSWRGTEQDGGTLFTQFSHYIDALLWLLGDIREIRGFRRNQAHTGIILSEDCGVCALDMENGMLGGLNWSVNVYRENMEISLTILAENGTIRLGGPYMNRVEYQLGESLVTLSPGSGLPNDYGNYKGSMSHHDQVYANLVRALADETHPFTGPEDGLRTVQLIESIYKTISLS